MDADEAYQKTFTIYPRHQRFLESINQDNVSLALRTVLDSVKNGKEQTEKKQLLDNSIMFICFGFFFFILSSLITVFIPFITSVLLGVALLTYGGIGGLEIVLRRRTR